jgi:hypothetical protein
MSWLMLSHHHCSYYRLKSGFSGSTHESFWIVADARNTFGFSADSRLANTLFGEVALWSAQAVFRVQRTRSKERFDRGSGLHHVENQIVFCNFCHGQDTNWKEEEK